MRICCVIYVLFVLRICDSEIEAVVPLYFYRFLPGCSDDEIKFFGRSGAGSSFNIEISLCVAINISPSHKTRRQWLKGEF